MTQPQPQPQPDDFIPVIVNGKTEHLNRAEVEATLAKAKLILPPEEYRPLQEMYDRYLKALELIQSGEATENELLQMMVAPLDPKSRPKSHEA